ncbi:MAG: LodA/GoxA family CTQ-dependent oxidase [Limisphaerales bacterium]
MTLKIHPAIGIARLGNSPDGFYLAPRGEGDLPTACDGDGIRERTPEGAEVAVRKFVDSNGRVLRQAARFQVFVYDDQDPRGREIRLGDTLRFSALGDGRITGQEFTGTVKDIGWTVYLANKKAAWYQFRETQGEHGYAPGHPRRNADVTEPSARQKLIIDPGPRSVQSADPSRRTARFDSAGDLGIPRTFPPPLQPSSITTLGELRAQVDEGHGRLLVLGGHGNSGSSKTGFGQPYIQEYANNDGWFDDTSDGPVHATLLIEVTAIDGRPPDPAIYPPSRLSFQLPVPTGAWVIVGYPRYAPQVTDMVTLDDVVRDTAIRMHALDPGMYGPPPFDSGSPPPTTSAGWSLWRHLATWNPEYHPTFERDIWPILKRPSEYGAVMVFDSNLGGDPHNTGARGNFDRNELAIPPHEGENPTDRERRRAMRKRLYEMLRKPGQENDFTLDPGSGSSGPHPIGMPWLCGDNPISNVAPSKFLRLTETMLFLLRQWAEGKFISASAEGIQAPSPGPGFELDRGALANALGGSFCPGAEVCWIIRNPAIYSAPYRIHESAGYSAGNLRQTGNLSDGLEPGDLTKYSALPWQSDFNECSTQPIDVAYRDWNVTDPMSTGDPAKPDLHTTFWWPAHRPMRITTPAGASFAWSGSIPQTPLGDLQMVTAWSALDFIVDGAPAKK